MLDVDLIGIHDFINDTTGRVGYILEEYADYFELALRDTGKYTFRDSPLSVDTPVTILQNENINNRDFYGGDSGVRRLRGEISEALPNVRHQDIRNIDVESEARPLSEWVDIYIDRLVDTGDYINDNLSDLADDFIEETHRLIDNVYGDDAGTSRRRTETFRSGRDNSNRTFNNFADLMEAINRMGDAEYGDDRILTQESETVLTPIDEEHIELPNFGDTSDNFEDINRAFTESAEDLAPVTPFSPEDLPTTGRSPLTPEQLRAVRHVEGPGLVVAGPGSGKTTVLRERLRYLTQELGKDPQKILSLAYGRAAKEELISRTKAFGEFKISTLHGLALQIVKGNSRRLGFARRPEVAEQNMLFNFVKRKLSTTASTNREVSYVTRQIEKARQQVSTGLFDPSILTDEFVVGSRGSGLRNTAPVGIGRMIDETIISLRDIAEEYENMKKSMGVLDYQDMLLLAGHLLESDEEIRNLYHEKYPFVQVDEFQDISPADWRLIKNLSPNLFAVGDDDQAIYGSLRGGTGDVMREFADVAEQYEILRNFRSTPQIVDASREFIEGSPDERLPKGLISGRESGSPVRHISSTRHDVIPKILEEIRKGGEIAILARENSELDWLRDQLPGDVLGDVEFSTIHSSKGREWERVLLPLNVTERGGEEYQSLPGQNTEAMQLREDRNLLYVGMTRAKNELVTLGDQYQHLFPQHERIAVTPIGSDQPISDTTDTTATETTPVETTPVETTPVETTPVETTPIDDTPPITTPADDGTAATDDVRRAVDNAQRQNDSIVGASKHLKEGWRGLYHRFRAHYQRVRAYQDMVTMERKGDIPDVEVYENLTAATLHRQKIEEIGKWIGLEPAPSGKRPTKLRAIDRMLAFLGNPTGVFLSSGLGTAFGGSFGALGAGSALWSPTGILGMMPFGLQKLSRRFDAAMYPASRRPTYDLNLDYKGYDKIPDELLSILPDDIIESALDFEGQLRNYRIVQAKMRESQFSERFFEFPDPETGWEGSHIDRPLYSETGMRMKRVDASELDELNRQGAELSEYFAYDTNTDTRDSEIRVKKYEPYGWAGDPYTRPQQGRTPLGLEEPANFFLNEFVTAVQENLEGTRKPDIPKDFFSVFKHLKRQYNFLKVWRKNHKALIRRVEKFQNWYASNVEGLEGDAHKNFIEREYLPKLNKLLFRLYPDRTNKGLSKWVSKGTGEFGKHAVHLSETIEKDLHALHLEVMDAVEEVWSEDSPYHKTLNWVFADSKPFELPDGTKSEITPLTEPFQRPERGVEELAEDVGRTQPTDSSVADDTFVDDALPSRTSRKQIDIFGDYYKNISDFNKSAVKLAVNDVGMKTGEWGAQRTSSGVYLGDRRVLVTLHQIIDEIEDITDEAGKVIKDRFRPIGISAAGMFSGNYANVIGIDHVDVENELAILRLGEEIDALPARLASGTITGERLRGTGVRSADSRVVDFQGRMGQRGGFFSSVFGKSIDQGVSGTGVFNALGELVGLLSAGRGTHRTFMRDATAIKDVPTDQEQYFDLDEFLNDLDMSTQDLKGAANFEMNQFPLENSLMTQKEMDELNELIYKKAELDEVLKAAIRVDAEPSEVVRISDEIDATNEKIQKFGMQYGKDFIKRRDPLIQEILPRYQEFAKQFPNLNFDEIKALYEDRVGKSDIFNALPNLLDPSMFGDLANLDVNQFTRSFRGGQHVGRTARSDTVSPIKRTGAQTIAKAVDFVEPKFTGLLEGIDSLKDKTAKLGNLSGFKKIGRAAGLAWNNPFSKILRKGTKKIFIGLEILDVYDKAMYFSGRREEEIASQVLAEGGHGVQQFLNVSEWLEKSPELKEIVESGVIPDDLSYGDKKVAVEAQKVYGEAAEGLETSFNKLIERRKVLEEEITYGRDITSKGDNYFHSRAGAVVSGVSPIEQDYLQRESEEFLWWDIPNWVGSAIRFLDKVEKITPSKIGKGFTDPTGEVHFSDMKNQLEEVNTLLEHESFKGMEVSTKDSEQRVRTLASRFTSNKQLIDRLETGDYGGFGFGSEDERREKAFKYSEEMNQEYVDQLAAIDKIIEPLHKAYGYEGDFRSPEYKRKLLTDYRKYEKDPQTGYGIGAYRDVITEESSIYKANVPIFDLRKLRSKIGFNEDLSWSRLDVMRTQQVLSLLDERQRIVDKQVVLPTQQIKNLEEENQEIINTIGEISTPTTNVGSARAFESQTMAKYKANQASISRVDPSELAARPDSKIKKDVDAAINAVSEINKAAVPDVDLTDGVEAIKKVDVSDVLAATPDTDIERRVRKLVKGTDLTKKSESEQKRFINEFIDRMEIGQGDYSEILDIINKELDTDYPESVIKKDVKEDIDKVNEITKSQSDEIEEITKPIEEIAKIPKPSDVTKVTPDAVKVPSIERAAVPDISGLTSTISGITSSGILSSDYKVHRPKGKFLGLFGSGKEDVDFASPEFIKQYIKDSGVGRRPFKATPTSQEDLKKSGSYVIIKSLEDVMDADTVKGIVHHEGKSRDTYVRFEGIDAAEIDPEKKYKYNRERPGHMIEREAKRGLMAQRELRAILVELNEGRTENLILPLEMTKGAWEVGDFGRTLGKPDIAGIDYYKALIDQGWAKVYTSPADVGDEFPNTVEANYRRDEWDKAQRYKVSLEGKISKMFRKAAEESTRAQTLLPAQKMEYELQSLMTGELLKGKDTNFGDYLGDFQSTVRTRIAETQKNILTKRGSFDAKRDEYAAYSVVIEDLPASKFTPELQKKSEALEAEMNKAEDELKSEEDLLKEYLSLLQDSGKILDSLNIELAKAKQRILIAGQHDSLIESQELYEDVGESITTHQRGRSTLTSDLVGDLDFVKRYEKQHTDALEAPLATAKSEYEKWDKKYQDQLKVVEDANKEYMRLENLFIETKDITMKEPGTEYSKAVEKKKAEEQKLGFYDKQRGIHKRVVDTIGKSFDKSDDFVNRAEQYGQQQIVGEFGKIYNDYAEDVNETLFNITDKQRDLIPLSAYSDEAIQNITGRTHPLWQQWADTSIGEINRLQQGADQRLLSETGFGDQASLDTHLSNLRSKLGEDQSRLDELNQMRKDSLAEGKPFDEELADEAKDLDASVTTQKETIEKLEGLRERYVGIQEKLTNALTSITNALDKHARRLDKERKDITYKSASQIFREGGTVDDITKQLEKMPPEMREQWVRANQSFLNNLGKAEEMKKRRNMPHAERYAYEKRLAENDPEYRYKEYVNKIREDERLAEAEKKRQERFIEKENLRRHGEVINRRQRISDQVAAVPFDFVSAMYDRQSIGKQGNIASQKMQLELNEQIRQVQDDMYLSANQKEKQIQNLRETHARRRIALEKEVEKARTDALNNVWKGFLKNLGGDIWNRAHNMFSDKIQEWLWGTPINGGMNGQASQGGWMDSTLGAGLDWLLGTGTPQNQQIGGQNNQTQQQGIGGQILDTALQEGTKQVIKDPGKLGQAWNWVKGLFGGGGGAGTAATTASTASTAANTASTASSLSQIAAAPAAPGLGAGAGTSAGIGASASSIGATAGSAAGSSALASVASVAGPLALLEFGSDWFMGSDSDGGIVTHSATGLYEMGKGFAQDVIWEDLIHNNVRNAWNWLGDTFSFDNKFNDMIARRCQNVITKRYLLFAVNAVTVSVANFSDIALFANNVLGASGSL